MIAQIQHRNTKLKKLITTLSILLLLPALTIAAPITPVTTFTLDQCISYGLTHNPEIKAYRLAVDAAGQGINQAWGAFLPTLSISYNNTDLSNGTSGERDSDYLDQQSETLSYRLTQPLFTSFSGIAGLKRARQSKQYRQAELQYMQQQLVRETSLAFYELIHANQLVDQRQASVARLEQQATIVTAWVAQQLAPKLRQLEVNVELSNARQQYIQATTQQVIARAKLREWLALNPQQPLTVAGTLTQDVIDPCTDVAACIAQAQRQRPEITMAQRNIDIARQDAKIILARNLPQAQLDASWVDYQRVYDESRYPDDDRDYYSVTLNLSIRPFQGGRNISAYRQQNITVDRYQQLLAKQKNAITTEVQTRYQQLAASRAHINNAQITLTAADEAYRVAFKSAELGVVSLDDLLNAELRLSRAEITLIESYHALQQAHILLTTAIGHSAANCLADSSGGNL